MSSDTSPNDAKVSAAAVQLASLEVTDGKPNAKKSDTSTDGDGAAPPSEAPPEEDERVLDPDLWRPHPPMQECPVCCVPLPLASGSTTYWVCCGKTICTGCSIETMRAENVINAKRAKKKQPPLDHACSFCRVTKGENKSAYEKRIRMGDVKATYNLALKYQDGDASINIPKDEAKYLELLHHAADELGYSTAMMELGRAYSAGQQGVTKDVKKGRKYSEDAVKLGNVHGRCILGMIEAEEGNIDLAIRHWKVAAAAGDGRSVRCLWAWFFKGKLEKAELEVALRDYKEACDATNSEERERWKLFEKIREAGNDVSLERLLGSYYLGEINAKQLKAEMKAIQAQR